MAYYSSNFYEGDPGEFYRVPSNTTSYDIVPFQRPITHSSYEFSEPGLVDYNSTAYSNYSNAYNLFLPTSEIKYSTQGVTEPKLIGWNPNPYGVAYDPFLTRSEINYSTYSVTEPKLIEYNPNPYSTNYFSAGTQYAASYSTKSEVDDSEFEEYDPTPYEGGYDPTLTYGKPLAPSDEICYPRSDPESNVPFWDNFSFESIPSPYGKDDVNEYSEKPPHNGTEPTKATEEQKPPENALESSRDEPVEGPTRDDDYPWSGYDYWGGNERNEGYGSRNGNDNDVVQTPYGQGLDAMDLCENLFGYWPCLYRNNRQNYGNQDVGSEERQENQWLGAADYFFGSPYSNGGDEAGNYGGPNL